jgi:hypothetical protein
MTGSSEPLIYLGGDVVARGGSKRGRRRTQRRKRLRWPPLPLGFMCAAVLESEC